MAVHATAGLLCTCDRCRHTWRSKTSRLPNICPECKSKYWNAGKNRKAGK